MCEKVTSYLIPHLSEKRASRFLNRVGLKQRFDTVNQEYNIFVYYYQNQLADSFSSLQNQFPDYCIDQMNFEPKRRFVIQCPTFHFGKILDFSQALECQAAYQSIQSCIDIPRAEFQIRGQIWQAEKPKIMGILNITPDSFYDGGKNLHKESYIQAASNMIQAGADIIDIGGESTRPGSQSVEVDEEIKRIISPLKEIRSRFDIPISIDTVKPEVAAAALELGADMINDVSGLAAGKKMLSVINQYKASYCLMHTQGQPRTMQKNPNYFDVLAELLEYFNIRITLCLKHNVPLNRILLDPGIGFGKLIDHNLDLLRFMAVFQKIGCLILQGSSNKAFIGKLLDQEVDNRLFGTITTQALGLINGGTVFRVHEVKENKDALKMAAGYLDI
ncbi:MAG: dihydropteroate synthase [Deltaproteobacteria bacterium]|jgi:dihydropteroate synthase|nr:dihydropteroate synthase [Deltaproteobacteria bacterium]MBT4525046.1 dihydropteroate synthase [Deltaproteobacteria bacterium]